MSSDLCLLIRHARILMPTGDILLEDVLTRGREIVQVAPNISALADKEIDATGLTVLPGVRSPGFAGGPIV